MTEEYGEGLERGRCRSHIRILAAEVGDTELKRWCLVIGLGNSVFKLRILQLIAGKIQWLLEALRIDKYGESRTVMVLGTAFIQSGQGETDTFLYICVRTIQNCVWRYKPARIYRQTWVQRVLMVKIRV